MSLWSSDPTFTTVCCNPLFDVPPSPSDSNVISVNRLSLSQPDFQLVLVWITYALKGTASSPESRLTALPSPLILTLLYVRFWSVTKGCKLHSTISFTSKLSSSFPLSLPAKVKLWHWLLPRLLKHQFNWPQCLDSVPLNTLHACRWFAHALIIQLFSMVYVI